MPVSAHDKRPMEEPVTFDNPPVGEVALAVQFAQPATDDASTLGRFWPRIQNEYPQVQVQPSLPPMSEDFEAPLTARGMPSSPDVEGVLEFADYGRDLIVRTFRDITTDEMHKEWQLR